MPGANRYLVPGYLYPLTHRCHDRMFLMKSARDRQRYRTRLWEGVRECEASLLTYTITGNLVYRLACADGVESTVRMMQQAAAESAGDYSRRKQRSGAPRESRYRARMVDPGRYLWRCLQYVELTMVRWGVVAPPGDRE